MLVASQGDIRIEAWNASKGLDYRCPECAEEVILKQGQKVIHHFSHRAKSNCSSGETMSHLLGKRVLHESFAGRAGFSAHVEFPIETLHGDRRADIIVADQRNEMYALEIQHSPIDVDMLYKRSLSYMSIGIRPIWIPFLKPSERQEIFEHRDHEGVAWLDKTVLSPWMKWIHAFNYGHLWLFDEVDRVLWKATKQPHHLLMESDWNGGYSYRRKSKRWSDLKLEGPYLPSELELKPTSRAMHHRMSGGMNFPSGKSATLEPIKRTGAAKRLKELLAENRFQRDINARRLHLREIWARGDEFQWWHFVYNDNDRHTGLSRDERMTLYERRKSLFDIHPYGNGMPEKDWDEIKHIDTKLRINRGEDF